MFISIIIIVNPDARRRFSVVYLTPADSQAVRLHNDDQDCAENNHDSNN